MLHYQTVNWLIKFDSAWGEDCVWYSQGAKGSQYWLAEIENPLLGVAGARCQVSAKVGCLMPQSTRELPTLDATYGWVWISAQMV